MVIIVHCSSYIEGHELQARDEASQGAVAVLQHRVHLGHQEACGTRRNAILWVYEQKETKLTLQSLIVLCARMIPPY